MSCDLECGTLEIFSRDVVEHDCLDIINHDVVDCFPVVIPTTVEIVGRGPQGPSGTTPTFVLAEVPTGLINDVNTIFTTVDPFTQIWVFKNGVRQTPSIDYDITDVDEITFVSAPLTGDGIIVDYTPA